eukprot:CAMPEP_0185481478 /NCGR_PEP_ID=MMETSP1366-20130426/7056_1 /TAXON_ID=38817 /ORGANISM="Gephyrocapsa oceanica, Strain RCC1303" /LENGTH=91 /DNA_ID=CAMNT_0028089181 /DNA_START=185 /DNA_END=456 /DNA_ORIENTATION=+
MGLPTPPLTSRHCLAACAKCARLGRQRAEAAQSAGAPRCRAVSARPPRGYSGCSVAEYDLLCAASSGAAIRAHLVARQLVPLRPVVPSPLT